VRVSSIAAERFDYESELVIVMGKKARNVSEPKRSPTYSATATATTSPRATCSRGAASG